MIKLLGPWTRDERAYDPSAQVRTVEVDGRLFTVHNVTGPGWPMVVRPADNPRLVSDMAEWERWDQVKAAARRCMAIETQYLA